MVKIFVGRLSEAVTRDQLQKLFEKYGEVSDCDILRDYGFVHMANEEKAHHAIRELDRMEINGSKISVELSTSRSMKSCQLVVGNLPLNVTSHDVHKLFKKYGTVTLCRITGHQAVVHMRWASMAVQAIRSLNGETYRGNVISVQFANSSNTPNITKGNAKDEWFAVMEHTNKPPIVLSNRHTTSAAPRYPPITQSTVQNFTPAWTTPPTFTNNHILTNGDVPHPPPPPLAPNIPPPNAVAEPTNLKIPTNSNSLIPALNKIDPNITSIPVEHHNSNPAIDTTNPVPFTKEM